MVGALLEVEVAKICTTPVRENDLEVKSLKTEGARAFLEVEAAKICTMRARTIWKSKSLKTDGVGALLEVEVDKLCTTPARDSDLEVKIVKKWHDRTTF